MNDILLQLYHNLPVSMRSIAASLWGYYLRWWRYGPETDRLLEETFEREHWSTKQWKMWQEERLAFVLHRAATRVPYYRSFWAKRRQNGDRSSWEYLENWPIQEKEPLRQNPTIFLVDDCKQRFMFQEHTSGTTGKPLVLWWSQKTARAWYALFEARCRRWHNVSRHDRWAILGGQIVTPIRQHRPPFWVWNQALDQLYMSSYHLAPDLIPYYLDALRCYRIKYLYGYTSSLYELAIQILRLGRKDLKMAVVITNAEAVFDYQRHVIAEAFQCPVRETYGMAEIVAAASECDNERIHLWPEVGVVEVLENDQAVSHKTAGDFICTGLLNTDMIMVRYRVGDHGSLEKPDTHCICGRTLPTLHSLEGRKDDVLYSRDGRRIGRLDPVFKARLPIHEAQVIQDALDKVRVRYVPAPGFNPAAGRSICERLQKRMGGVEVILEPVEEIPRDINGKFRSVICNLRLHEKKVLEFSGR